MSDLVIKHAGTEQTKTERGPVNPEVILGQAGSIIVSGTSAVTCKNGVFSVITMLEDTVFANGGLTSTDNLKYINDTVASTDISSSNGAVIDGETFPKGVTIYGRWTTFTLASGLVIAYRG
tara:strand:+ start:1125 stop:1487 length:363 start_codon:yes stop_codon:yes gene_type:complete